MFASVYSESLIKTACQHLLILVVFDTLIYRKYYDTLHVLVGHQPPRSDLGFLSRSRPGESGQVRSWCWSLPQRWAVLDCLFMFSDLVGS